MIVPVIVPAPVEPNVSCAVPELSVKVTPPVKVTAPPLLETNLAIPVPDAPPIMLTAPVNVDPAPPESVRHAYRVDADTYQMLRAAQVKSPTFPPNR